MWIRATNGDCFNLAHFRRIFIQRGQQGTFDNKMHLTIMGEGNQYSDLAVIDLREMPSETAVPLLEQYFADITAAMGRGDGYFELPQTGEW